MHHSHFLLSPAARTLSLRDLFPMTWTQMFELFREVRWGADADPVGPERRSVDRHWLLAGG